jgi:hypothetical protein
MKQRNVAVRALLTLAITAVFGSAHAQQYIYHSTVDTFESLPVGAGPFASQSGLTYNQYVSIESDGSNKYLTGWGPSFGFNRYEFGSFDVAVKTPVSFDGVAATSYLVMVEGFTKFPVARELRIAAPGSDGLVFTHIGRNDLGGDYGEPYGYMVSSPSISVWACKIAGCGNFVEDMVHRSSQQPPFGDWDNYVQAQLAIDNLQVITFAVPEPSTYVMMLGGLAAIGLVRRRRKA